MDTEYGVSRPIFKKFFLVGAEMEISAGGISGLFHNFNGELLVLLLSKFADHLVYIALYVA